MVDNHTYTCAKQAADRTHLSRFAASFVGFTLLRFLPFAAYILLITNSIFVFMVGTSPQLISNIYNFMLNISFFALFLFLSLPTTSAHSQHQFIKPYAPILNHPITSGLIIQFLGSTSLGLSDFIIPIAISSSALGVGLFLTFVVGPIVLYRARKAGAIHLCGDDDARVITPAIIEAAHTSNPSAEAFETAPLAGDEEREAGSGETKEGGDVVANTWL